jgi:hypothetical protein
MRQRTEPQRARAGKAPCCSKSFNIDSDNDVLCDEDMTGVFNGYVLYLELDIRMKLVDSQGKLEIADSQPLIVDIQTVGDDKNLNLKAMTSRWNRFCSSY